jgi:hypothetical protein
MAVNAPEGNVHARELFCPSCRDVTNSGNEDDGHDNLLKNPDEVGIAMVISANRLRQTSGSQNLHTRAQFDRLRGVERRASKMISVISVGRCDHGEFS